MTAAVMEEDQQECLAAGMNGHVSKPIDPKDLTRSLLAWVPHGSVGFSDSAAVGL